MREFPLGHLRVRWDPEANVLYVRPDPDGKNRDPDKAELARLRTLLSSPADYCVLLDASGLRTSNYSQKATWFLFLTSVRRPRRLAVHASDAVHTRAIDVFGSIVRVPTRFFRSEQDALAWLREP